MAPPPKHFGRIKAHPPLAAPGQTIGLLGGSFNPPHAAHRLISETALKRLGLDKVWWVVSPGNPLKRRSDQAPLAERMVLCRAVAKNPRIEITDFEVDLPTPYTASTLAFLKSRSPLVRFVWIMGADNLASFDRWRNWREIFTTVPVVVVDRPGWRMKALASKAARAFAAQRVPETEARLLAHMPAPAWTFLTGPLSHVSSTALRNKAKARSQSVAKRVHAPSELPWRKAAPEAAEQPKVEAPPVSDTAAAG
ncbi:MAG: nicotinate-nucleotide adenylyltransferase [Hyphomicrobiaceae bacterium]|nr:MAG: nicotinate-nucleotide adenylyltransferase [Hyphomicrobiaceae bacterium]